jgi:hypothetical protein
VKPAVYASAGIPEYWVVDIERQRVLVHREPLSDRYRIRGEVGPAGFLDGSAVGIEPIAVADIFAVAQPPR